MAGTEFYVLAILLLTGGALNLCAFYWVFISKTNVGRTTSARFLLLLKNLIVADLLVLFLHIPNQLFVYFTQGWPACTTLCKLMNFASVLCFYIQSNTIVCIAIDRLISVYKLKAFTTQQHRLKTIRFTLLIAWILALLCASPQLWLFNVIVDPTVGSSNGTDDVSRVCTSIWFSNLSSVADEVSPGTANKQVFDILH